MTISELKQSILSKSFGGVMYDITEGSEISQIVKDNERVARQLSDEIENNSLSNGIDKGIKTFIADVLS